MTGPSTAADNVARTKLYLGSAEQGVVFGRELNFYSGAPTTPVSFTGNQILGVGSNGPGANLINGVGPVPIETIPCEEPVFFSVVVNILADNVEVLLSYTLIPGDLYEIFTTGEISYAPISVEILSPSTVRLLFPDEDLLAAGTYNLKVMRASDPTNCFTIAYSLFEIASAVCALSITDLTSPTGFPVVPPGPAGSPFGSFTVELVGAGFLSGPVTVTIGPNNFAPFDTIVPDLVTIIDDNNNMDIDFTGNGVNGVYGVRVELDSDPACFAEIGFGVVMPFIALVAA